MAPGEASPMRNGGGFSISLPSTASPPYIDIYPYHCLMVYNMIYIIIILS